MPAFEAYLEGLQARFSNSRTKEAMFYSLLAGGKRVRPRLLFAALEGYGRKAEYGFPCAAAIEMIHTYSLIHDDLPAMDDDTLRRGRKTCHIAFDEATAILAGDALLTAAFSIVLDSDCRAAQKVRLVQLLAQYAGVDGMILGQTLDIAAEHRKDLRQQDLEQIHYGKTGKLLTLPLVCAAVLCEQEEDLRALEQIGMQIGLSFQIQDDVMDVTLDAAQSGKSSSDAKNEKVTYVSLLGVDAARDLANTYYTRAKEACKTLHMDAAPLLAYLDVLKTRRS